MARSDRAERVAAYIEGVRQELFGSPAPPFREAADAWEWLHQESNGAATPDYVDRAERFRAMSDRLFKEMRAAVEDFPMGLSMHIGVRAVLVAWHAADGSPRRLLARTHQLRRLAEEASTVATFAGCSDGTATMAILAGTPIPTRAITRARTIAVGPLGVTVRQSLSAPVGPAIVAEAFPSAPEESPKDRALLAIINKLRADGHGAPPRPRGRGVNEGVRKYWRSVQDRWNGDPKYRIFDPFRDWTSVRKRYDRYTERQKAAPRRDGIAEWLAL